MQTENETLLGPVAQNPLLIILDLILGYMGYGLLTFPIIITLAMVIWDYLIIFGSKLPEFLDYIPEQWVSNIPAELTADDIMGAYFLLTTLFWAVARLVSIVFSLIQRLAGKAPLPAAIQSEPPAAQFKKAVAHFIRHFPRRLLWSALPTTAVFLTALVAMPFSDMFKREDFVLYCVIMIVFCVIAVGFIFAHVLWREISELILAFAQYTLTAGHVKIAE